MKSDMFIENGPQFKHLFQTTTDGDYECYVGGDPCLYP